MFPLRALVVGNVFRRLVARELAQHIAAAFQEACLPYQFGLSTRAGTEGLYKLLHTATTIDPRATVLSWRRCCRLPGSVLAAAASTHVLTMSGLGYGEATFAVVDDSYVVAPPERIAATQAGLQEALWAHACIQLNAGKTRMWNAAGEEPPGIAHLQTLGGEPVWTGSWSFPAAQQRLVVLGAPIGSDAFVQQELRRERGLHDEFLNLLPTRRAATAALLPAGQLPAPHELAVPSAQFRVILLRRLRLPLPAAQRTCACRGRLNHLVTTARFVPARVSLIRGHCP